jgi:diguanylate cyclase (GGDEF)-like protein
MGERMTGTMSIKGRTERVSDSVGQSGELPETMLPMTTALDNLATLAAGICRTPCALLSFLETGREAIHGRHGCNNWCDEHIAAEEAFAVHALTDFCADDSCLFLVQDAADEERFTANVLVTGEPHVRFYAAVILIAEGIPVGLLRVMDTMPRLLDAVQADALRSLGEQALLIFHLNRQLQELTDLTDAHVQAEESARWQARHDVLTGLPNRAMFLERAEALLTQGTRDTGEANRKARRKPTNAAILFVDLDRFKRVNDTLGHAAGDMLLREVAARFSGCLRPEDTLARFAGDEFTVLLPDIPSATYAANVAQMLVRTLRRPVIIGTQEVHVGASIGIALHPRDGQDAQTLLKHADIAMYQAKAKGGFQAYSRSMNSDGYQRLLEESALRHAIEQEELSVCYQPLVDLESGGIVGIEALARWRHPERGPIPPAHFIELAEQADLIVPLGEWVLRRACRDVAALRQEGNPDLRVAVNLSARQLTHPNLVSAVAAALSDYGLDGSALDLELTETALCNNGDETPQTLQRLREMGTRLFVDDFGTGYSSLAYLRQFQVDALKIDHAFVAGLGKKTPDAALIRAIIEMAHALDLSVIAEGVELPIQADLLQRMGCDVVQGYLFSRPVPLESLKSLLLETSGARQNTNAASGRGSISEIPHPNGLRVSVQTAPGALTNQWQTKNGFAPLLHVA